ncbi:CASP-like protein [Quillaja saponaria]|uniref:CASP-like protein n=1 Tax=Quillaja saponaria TaxID=32244 RepID=A0AAD7VDJ5_QUISA|nr:CASP-like protein [Quillaja saponaria]
MAVGRNSSILQPKPLGILISTPEQKTFFIAQFILRFLAIIFTVTSISVMVTSRQSVKIFGFNIEARFYYSSANKFLVGVEAVVCAFSVLTLVLVLYYLLRRGGFQPRSYFFLFMHDMVMMLLMISGCVAATSIGYVGRYGEEHMYWQPVCNHVGRFCNKILVAVVLSYLAFLAYLALTSLTAYKLYVNS